MVSTLRTVTGPDFAAQRASWARRRFASRAFLRGVFMALSLAPGTALAVSAEPHGRGRLDECPQVALRGPRRPAKRGGVRRCLRVRPGSRPAPP